MLGWLRAEELGLALETGSPFGVLYKGVGKHFDRRHAAQVCIACAIDLAHRAGAQERDYLIWSDAVTR